MTKNRNFNFKDVDMLMASETIADSFLANITELSAVRSNWTPDYATSLQTRIATTLEEFIGVDAKKALREATANLEAIQVPALRDLSLFKIQIDDDFKAEPKTRDEILKNLGFTAHLRNVQNGNQESLVQLLYTFKTNMTAKLKTQITAKGMGPSLIDNIVGYAVVFAQANVAQETNKGTTKEVTQETADAINAIYDEMIGICKIASNYFKFEPLKKEQFTFAKVIANLGSSGKGGVIPPQPVEQEA